jgi:hypothetical protein
VVWQKKIDLLLIKSLLAVKVADHLEDEHVDTGLCTYCTHVCMWPNAKVLVDQLFSPVEQLLSRAPWSEGKKSDWT